MKKVIVLSMFIMFLSSCTQNHQSMKIEEHNNQKSYKTNLTGVKGLTENKISKETIKKKNTHNITSSRNYKWKPELSREFNNVYLSNKANNYDKKCYLLLDIDYENKQFVLYRNKLDKFKNGLCKLDGVEKIGVLWYHNGLVDPKGEYILKSYDSKTGLFEYVISKKKGNLGTGKNEYEFSFYLNGGQVVKYKFKNKIITSKKLDNNKKMFVCGNFDKKGFLTNIKKMKLNANNLKVINMNIISGPMPCYEIKDLNKVIVVGYTGDTVKFYGINYKIYNQKPGDYDNGILKFGNSYLLTSKRLTPKNCNLLLSYKGVDFFSCKVNNILAFAYSKEGKFNIIDIQPTDKKPFVQGLGNYIIYTYSGGVPAVKYLNIKNNKQGNITDIKGRKFYDGLVDSDMITINIKRIGIIGNKYLYIWEHGEEYEMGGIDTINIYSFDGNSPIKIYSKDVMDLNASEIKNVHYDKLTKNLIITYLTQQGEQKELKISEDVIKDKEKK